MARKIEIDGNCIESREDLFASLKEQLASEDFIGNNLDALYDVLTEGTEPVEVEFRNMGRLRAALGGYTDRLLRVLMDCQARCAKRWDTDGAGDGEPAKSSAQNDRPDGGGADQKG